jgi:exopolyphosphatase/guanosine-5'-triphosphate,3'-diphosphate pyrophosphatase
MKSDVINLTGQTVAFIDMGTNSIRLLLVESTQNRSYQIITQQKETVRLGEGEFIGHRLQAEAMGRAILVCQKFAGMAKDYGATEIIAVATSATRGAGNRAEFLYRLQAEAGITFSVISGREEARLIYLGITSGTNLKDQNTVFIDIGGGSVEVIAGNQQQFFYLDSLKLGAIRLATLFPETCDGPVSPESYLNLQKYIRHTAIRSLQELAKYPAQLVIGSSGTIENLANIASRMFKDRHYQKDDQISHEQLKQAIQRLTALTMEERQQVGGLNPDRADIIIGGAAVLDTLMTELKIAKLQVSRCSLRDGLLIDYRLKHNHFTSGLSLREQSIFQLGQVCHFNPTHARKVAELALELFDSGNAAGFLSLSDEYRELLYYAALLHDIGAFLSYHNHQQHSYYLIRNADLLGFNQLEITIIAMTALFHRKALPRKHADYTALDKVTRQTVAMLSVILRLAECLERSHNGAITHARFADNQPGKIRLEITAAGDIQLELWGLQNQQKAFHQVFKRYFNPKVLRLCQL